MKKIKSSLALQIFISLLLAIAAGLLLATTQHLPTPTSSPLVPSS